MVNENYAVCKNYLKNLSETFFVDLELLQIKKITEITNMLFPLH